MKQSTRFPVAINILAVLAAREGEFVSSYFIAKKSVGTNPVAIRKIIGMLTRAGLIQSQAGTHGGAKLAKTAKKITLFDVYNAVEHDSIFCLHDSQTKCPVASGVKKELQEVFDRIENEIKRILKQTSLYDVAARGMNEFEKIRDFL